MSIDAMKQALEALEFANVNHWWGSSNIEKSITALRLAIEQAEQQEPVCDKDPRGCWNVRCQLGKVCKNTALRLAIEQAEKQEPVADDAYDMIDRFLRNNLDDTDYAEYSDALDRLYTAPPQRQPQAAAELRRLHSVNAQLLEALEMGYADSMDYITRNHLSGAENNHWLVAARAAIAAAKEQA